MDKKELFKNIDIDGRKFILGKFDARTGSYILFKLVGILTPLFNSIKDLENLDDLNLTELASSLFSLSEDDFRYVQDNCLMIVKELLPGGTPQILNEYGIWGANDIEFDTQLVMNLTIQSLVFNVSNFFGGNLLVSLRKGLTSFQQNSKI
jgi:hypothetical protein